MSSEQVHAAEGSAHTDTPSQQQMEKRGSDITPTETAQDEKWWTDAEEKALRRKLDWNIIPQVFVIYGLAFIDRSNVGNAKTAGMAADLGITDAQYRWVTTIFYIAYIIFQSSLLFYLIVPPRIWISATIFTWGVASSLQATATSFSGLMAARFFVGVAEAAFGTGIGLYLGFFYTRQDVGFRFSLYATAAAFASSIAGALAYGLVQADSAVAPWRLLFIVEGAPSIILSFFTLFFIPDSPDKCRFLNDREKRLAKARLFKPESAGYGAADAAETKFEKIKYFLKSKLDPASIKAGLLNPVAWLTALMLWVVNVGYGSLPIYLPQILAESGLTKLKAQGYTAPPYLAAWIYSLLQVYWSDRLQHRATFVMLNYAIGIAGYIMLALSSTFRVRYAACWLVVLGLFPQVSMSYIWLITNCSSEKARGVGLAILGTVAQTGPLLGTLGLYPSREAPYYRKGMWTSTGVLFGGVVIAVLSIAYFKINNRRRDAAMLRRESEAEERGSEEKQNDLTAKTQLDMQVPAESAEALRRHIDVLRRGEDSPYFRYIL